MREALSLWHGSVAIPVPPRTSQDILRTVAEAHHMTVAEMLSPRRATPYVRARWAAMMVLSETPMLSGRLRSLPEIGRAMGGLDHTTVLHGLIKSGSKRYARQPAAKREAEAA